MADRSAGVAFVITLLGATYQMISYALGYLIDHQFIFFYYIGLGSYLNSFGILIIFWAMAHLLDKQDSRRTTWPAIILGIGVADLANLLIAWLTPVNTGQYPPTTQTLPLDIGLTFLPGPPLLILGGIFGFISARRARRAAAVITSLNSPQ